MGDSRSRSRLRSRANIGALRLTTSALGILAGSGLIAAGIAGGSGPVYAGLTPTLPSPALGISPTPVALPSIPLPTPTPVVPPTVIPTPVPSIGPLPLPGSGQGSGGSGSSQGQSGSSHSGSGSPNGSHSSSQQGSSQSPQQQQQQQSAQKAQQRRYGSEYRDNAEMQHEAQVYQQQDHQVLSDLPALEKLYDALALAAGGGKGRFGTPEITDPKHPTPITQPFGCTNFMGEPMDPDCNTKHIHTGIDVAGPADTPVFAADTGVAAVFEGPTGYGNYVVLTDGNGFQQLFGHLDKVLVKTGDLVHKGDVVGLEGSTGFSTGFHLHFEIRFKGGFVDPCTELDCLGGAALAGALPNPPGSANSPGSASSTSRRLAPGFF